jgi:hypothetical protein
MHANGFMGMMWGFESELYAGPNPSSYATVEDYETVIAFYSNLRTLHLPLLAGGY